MPVRTTEEILAEIVAVGAGSYSPRAARLRQLLADMAVSLDGEGGGGGKQTYRFTYDFAVLGGAIGDIVLTALDGALPDNFIVIDAFLDIVTIFTGGAGATVGISSGETADDILPADTLAFTSFDIVNFFGLVPGIKMTAARSPVLTIAVADLTAGKFNLFLKGYVSA